VEVSKAKQLKQLEEEPRQLKHIVAGGRWALKAVLAKKW